MRVHKGDLLKLEDGGDERVMRVVKLQASQMRIWLVAHNEGGNFQERHDTDNEIDPFRWQWPTLANLKGRQARLVSVDVLGRVHDGGFKG
jgi:CRISPR-associated endonuclease Csn1